jgi:hypothetical protein
MSTRRGSGDTRSVPQSCVPIRSRPASASRARQDSSLRESGPSSAIGSSRSLTMMRVPREAIRRYLLRLALSSDTLMAFVAPLQDHDGLVATAPVRPARAAGTPFEAPPSMPNTNRNKKNQPPTGHGKNQPRTTGAGRQLEKRSDTGQAIKGRADLNLADSGEEYAFRSPETHTKRREKAGR